MNRSYLAFGAVLVAMMACISSAALVGSSAIRAPAVITYNDTGSLTAISLTITTGNGTVNFTNRSTVGNSTFNSAVIAAEYGSQYAGKNFSRYDFTYTVFDGGSNVSGPSAGAAMTLLAISAFEHKPLNNEMTITGTISPDGTVGQVGGVIDKVGAASGGGLDVVLVPWAQDGSIEQGTYYIAQTEYKIPLVEVSNISQAAGYEFGAMPGAGNEVMINFSRNYMVGTLPQAQLNCTNACEEAPFEAFSNYTLNITQAQIAHLAGLPGFGKAAAQLMNVSDQAAAIHQNGYLYISADIAFLDYLDAFYLNSYNVSRDGALGYMQDLQASCESLVPPQLTSANYEYVIGAELRQGWANYTINSTLSDYNASAATRDDIVSSMYSAGQTQAWCGAAAFLYNYSYQGNDTPETFSYSLGQIAIQRINRAAPYPGMYLTLAKEAYTQHNYPVAIIDADYAYELTTSALKANQNASELVNESAALAANSTYGVWATEFSKEALFYDYESFESTNSTEALFYADEAYSSASLASQISNDTGTIYASLAPYTPSTTSNSGAPGISGGYGPGSAYMLDRLADQVRLLTLVVEITLALVAGLLFLVLIMAHRLMVLSAGKRRKTRERAR